MIAVIKKHNGRRSRNCTFPTNGDQNRLASCFDRVYYRRHNEKKGPQLARAWACDHRIFCQGGGEEKSSKKRPAWQVTRRAFLMG
jgi:hypothetical protein